jgi:hypothetical protein
MPPTTPEGHRQFLVQRVPEFRALSVAREGAIYVCGAEQLQGLTHHRVIGDVAGPYSYAPLVERSDEKRLAGILRSWSVRSLLVARPCRKLAVPQGDFELLYVDDAARLYRLR